MLATETPHPVPVTDNINYSIMSNTGGGEGDEASIKAAVRDAARKTQDRLAAFQKKQEVKVAAVAVAEFEKKNAPPSKDKVQVESTVSRLQALVSESKRLTNKSRELNTLPEVPIGAAAATADEPPPFTATTKDNTDLSRNTSFDNNAGVAAAPKGRNLSEIMQSMTNTAFSAGASKGAVPTSTANLTINTAKLSSEILPLAPALARSTSQGNKEIVSKLNGKKGKKGEKLGSSLFQSLSSGATQTGSSLNNSSSSLPTFSDQTNTEDELDVLSASDRDQPKTILNRDDSLQALLGTIKDSGLLQNGLNKFGSASQRAVVEEAQNQQEQQKQVLQSLSVVDVDVVKFDDDDDDDSNNIEIDEEDDNNSNSSGEMSILSMVEDAKKKKKIKVNGMEVDQDDAEEMMQDYYNSSQASLASQLEEVNTSTSLKSKNKKKKKSAKTKNKKEDSNGKVKASSSMGDSIPNLEAITATPKFSKPKISLDIDIDDEDDDDFLDASMPTLDPFDTPKGFKPKIVHPAPMIQRKDNSRQGKWNKKLLAVNKNLESARAKSMAADDADDDNAPPTPDGDDHALDSPSTAPSTEDANKGAPSTSPMVSPITLDTSMNLSQVFQQSLVVLADDNSPKKCTAVRRPSLENVQEEEEDDSDNKSMRSSSRSKSRGRSRDGDDVASAKSSGSKSSAKSRRKSKKNKPPKRKSSFKDGAEGGNADETVTASKSAEGDKEIEGKPATKPGLDISELSADDSAGMQDGSDLTSSSRSVRRGRTSTLAGGSGHSRQEASRSRSVRRGASTRSQSRSASVRRRRAAAHPRPNKAESMDGSMRDASMRESSVKDSSRRRSREGNACLREGSFKDASRRRRSISHRRASRRPSQRGGGDDDDQSQASTADEILSSLDVSDIQIVGEVEHSEGNPMADDSRTSIYDKKEKRPSVKGPPKTSLAGLSQLESASGDVDQPAEECSDSLSDSVQSSTTKTSRMSKFAQSVGRGLGLKKQGKSKKETGTAAEMATASGADDSSDGGDEEFSELEVDTELEALVAEYDAEEQEIEQDLPSRTSSGESSISGDDPAEISEGAANDTEVSKSKKKRGSVMFSAIKKVGKLTKKKKKKDKKDKKDKKGKDSDALDSDSDSEGGDELQGSGYSGGTLDRSGSEDNDLGDPQAENFVQLQFDGAKASVSMCGENQAEETVPSTPTKGRQRRASAVNMRRQRVDKQRSQSLHAVLGKSVSVVGDDESSVQGSVKTTDTRIRTRRAQSLRGRVQRNRGEGSNPEDAQAGSKKGVDIKRAKSLKGRIEGASKAKPVKSKRIRRCKSVVVGSAPAKKNIEENEVPSFDWQAYSSDNKLPTPAKKARNRRKSTKAKELDKRLSGGLSKVIYHTQELAS